MLVKVNCIYVLGCIILNSIGIFVLDDGNLNFIKYIEVLYYYLWFVIVKVFVNFLRW